VNLRRGLAATAGVCSVVTLGIALESGNPARALGPPADGTYSYNESGVSGVTWTLSSICDQPSGTRNMNDYSDPIIFAMQCALNVVSTTDEKISAADKLQNYSGRARMSSMLWSFTIDKSDGVSCPGGGTAPTTESWAFSDESMSGTHTVMHGPVCGLQAGMKKQPFSLAMTGPPPSPVQRYPMQCNNIAICY
ncbi:hypothetical protein BN1232_05248, partial [Mycobacterium rhizamassiliense]|jgi:hypothetical protein